MSATSKHQKTDASDRLPVPQHHDATRDEYDPRRGASGASRVRTTNGANAAVGATTDAAGAPTLIGQLKQMAQQINEATEVLRNDG